MLQSEMGDFLRCKPQDLLPHSIKRGHPCIQAGGIHDIAGILEQFAIALFGSPEGFLGLLAGGDIGE